MQYSVKGTDGNTYGPVDLQTLKEWASQGRVQPNSTVIDNLSNQTFLASSMSELGLVAAPNNPYASAPLPPQQVNQYPRMDGHSTASQSTRLWAILFWLALGIILSLFTRSGGLIVSGFNIFDAFQAKSRGDKYGVACIAVSIVGFLALLGFTYIKSQMGMGR
jgi:hypothetical protein